MNEYPIYVALVLIVIVAIGYLLFGVSVAILLACLAVFGVFCYQSIALYRFYEWLKHKQGTPNFPKKSIWYDMVNAHKTIDEHHQKNKAKLQYALTRLDHLVAAIPTGVLMVSEGGYVDWASELGRTHFALEGLVGHNPIYEHNPSISLSQHIDSVQLAQFLADVPVSKPTQTTLLIVFGQKKKWLTLTLVPFEAKISLLVSEDVSSKEQLNATRTDFVANVSHELRTPLTVIQGFLETLQDYPDIDDKTREEFIGLMSDESQKMLSIINDLLHLSRLENTPYVGDNKTPVNLSELIAVVYTDTQNLSNTHGTHHKITLQSQPDIWILGSVKDLYSALSNLTFNAILHTPPNTDIVIGLCKQGDQAVFFVEDTGQGIAPEHLPRLTERFYRVSGGRERTYKTQGSGLGLAITKYALFEHKSELFVQSTLGVGTRFWAQFECIDSA